MAQTNVYDKLKELGIELPSAGAPAAAYVMSAQSGNTVYLSGHIAKKDGKVWAGKLGATLTTEEGKVAARSIAIDLLATLHTHVGDLNRVTRIVKLMSLVNSTLEFTEQHLVTNGASELIADVFGERERVVEGAQRVADEVSWQLRQAVAVDGLALEERDRVAVLGALEAVRGGAREGEARDL